MKSEKSAIVKWYHEVEKEKKIWEKRNVGGVFYTYKLRAFIVSFQKQFYSTRYWNGIWIKEYCGTDDMVYGWKVEKKSIWFYE